MDPRDLLAAHCRTLGFTAPTLALIADSALPRYTPGRRLYGRDAQRVVEALELLAQAGATDQLITDSVAACKAKHGEDWRARWWAIVVRAANIRYAQPDLYGLSPLERDPERLAQWAAHGTPSAASNPASATTNPAAPRASHH